MAHVSLGMECRVACVPALKHLYGCSRSSGHCCTRVKLQLRQFEGVCAPIFIPPGNLEESSFFKTLLSGFCEGICMILDELATPLTRSWCLFEYLHALELSESRRFDNFQGLLFCHSSGVLNHGSASIDISLALGDCVGQLRLEDAEASRKKIRT